MDVVDLVAKAKKGDKEALIELVMNKKEEYYRLAYVYTGNKEDSLDALQNMIVILFDNVKKLKKLMPFIAGVNQFWLTSVKGFFAKGKGRYL